MQLAAPSPATSRLGMALVAATFTAVWPVSTAHAHQMGVSRGEYSITDNAIDADLVFARGELASTISGLDADQNGKVSEAEVRRATGDVGEAILGGLVVSSSAGPCRPSLTSVELDEEDGLRVKGRYMCAEPPEQVSFDLSRLLTRLLTGHRHVAFTTVGEVTVEHVTFRDQARFRVHAGLAAGSDESPPAETGTGENASVSTMDGFRRGFDATARTLEALGFLAAMLLGADRFKTLATSCLAALVGMALGLVLILSDTVAIEARYALPALSLCAVYLATENWWLNAADRRWLVGLPFGVVFGVALGAQGEAIAAGGLGWGLGVLAFAALVMLVAGPLIVGGRRSAFARDRAYRVLSLGVALAAVGWFGFDLYNP